jgi:FKBP-type peptidyl-prolyl cis-trans isomerase 2
MQQAKKGDNVSVHYTGKFADGVIFDSSKGREPLSFTLGEGHVIKGFDDAVTDMKIGDLKEFTVAPEEGYGLRNEEMVFDFPKEEFPKDVDLKIGMELNMSDDEGNMFQVVVTEIADEFVMLDANHPLAGKELIFTIELITID